MTDDELIHPGFASWLDQGPVRAPARAIDAAIQRVETVRQDRPPIAWRRVSVPWNLDRLALVALVMSVGLGVGLLTAWRSPVSGPPAAASNPASPRSTPGPRQTTGIVVLPDPSYVPYAGRSEDWLPVIAACLRDKGWDATIEWDGGMSTSVGPDRQSEFQADQFECWRVFGGPPSNPPLTEAEIRSLYDYLAHDLRDCLIGMGFAIGEPPSEEEFVSTYPTGEVIVTQRDRPWSPYLELPEDLNRQYSWREVNETCPQTPAD